MNFKCERCFLVAARTHLTLVAPFTFTNIRRSIYFIPVRFILKNPAGKYTISYYNRRSRKEMCRITVNLLTEPESHPDAPRSCDTSFSLFSPRIMRTVVHTWPPTDGAAALAMIVKANPSSALRE